ncbi:von Willebrand factor A [Candidatus Filomicrobium marinum]|uniref:von Willebrand factor A n=3 Tax=Candidatus Filomicrobium marinum TaxID=1608628 RepID=A0A0D6JDY2_9HYPH|nr:von Willebrand factor A [Candidatus Filomicrobium marinum]CPR18013.1 von Willebrand factor A [Candidatus Filomicrobium marinum]
MDSTFCERRHYDRRETFTQDGATASWFSDPSSFSCVPTIRVPPRSQMHANFFLPPLIQVLPNALPVSAETMRHLVVIVLIISEETSDMSVLDTFQAAAKAAALVLGLSLFALFIGLFLAIRTPAFAAEVNVTADLGQSVLPTQGGKVYLRLSLKPVETEVRESRPPVNVALVLDRSGSMRGKRLEAAKEATEMALSRLGRDDIVALIAYNHNVDILQAAERLTSHQDLQQAVNRLRADGTTALFAGVVEGGRQVEKELSERRINRVILMSDGQANVGPSSPGELAKLGQKLGGKGISVTTIGLGLGYNEDLMQRLALASDGNHAFAETPSDLVKIFNSEFGDALSIAAQDIEIIIECRKGFRPRRILGRTADIEGNRIKLKLNQLTGGHERYLVVELEADANTRAEPDDVAQVSVNYIDLDAGSRRDAKADVSVSFSTDQKAQEDSIDKAVMSQVAAQIATETSERAVELRDKGDVKAARKLLQDNAAYLAKSRAQYGSGPGAASASIVGTLNQLEAQNSEAASNLDGDEWSKTRKTMRYEQHKAKRQQSY